MEGCCQISTLATSALGKASNSLPQLVDALAASSRTSCGLPPWPKVCEIWSPAKDAPRKAHSCDGRSHSPAVWWWMCSGFNKFTQSNQKEHSLCRQLLVQAELLQWWLRQLQRGCWWWRPPCPCRKLGARRRTENAPAGTELSVFHALGLAQSQPSACKAG